MTEATIPVLPNHIANCIKQYRDFLRFLNIFFTGRKKIRVETIIVGRVGLPEPHNFFVLALVGLGRYSCHPLRYASQYIQCYYLIPYVS